MHNGRDYEDDTDGDFYSSESSVNRSGFSSEEDDRASGRRVAVPGRWMERGRAPAVPMPMVRGAVDFDDGFSRCAVQWEGPAPPPGLGHRSRYGSLLPLLEYPLQTIFGGRLPVVPPRTAWTPGRRTPPPPHRRRPHRRSYRERPPRDMSEYDDGAQRLRAPTERRRCPPSAARGTPAPSSPEVSVIEVIPAGGGRRSGGGMGESRNESLSRSSAHEQNGGFDGNVDQEMIPPRSGSLAPPSEGQESRPAGQQAEEHEPASNSTTSKRPKTMEMLARTESTPPPKKVSRMKNIPRAPARPAKQGSSSRREGCPPRRLLPMESPVTCSRQRMVFRADQQQLQVQSPGPGQEEEQVPPPPSTQSQDGQISSKNPKLAVGGDPVRAILLNLAPRVVASLNGESAVTPAGGDGQHLRGIEQAILAFGSQCVHQQDKECVDKIPEGSKETDTVGDGGPQNDSIQDDLAEGMPEEPENSSDFPELLQEEEEIDGVLPQGESDKEAGARDDEVVEPAAEMAEEEETVVAADAPVPSPKGTPVPPGGQQAKATAGAVPPPPPRMAFAAPGGGSPLGGQGKAGAVPQSAPPSYSSRWPARRRIPPSPSPSPPNPAANQDRTVAGGAGGGGGPPSSSSSSSSGSSGSEGLSGLAGLFETEGLDSSSGDEGPGTTPPHVAPVAPPVAHNAPVAVIQALNPAPAPAAPPRPRRRFPPRHGMQELNQLISKSPMELRSGRKK